MIFLSVISSLAIIKFLGKESLCILDFPMIDFLIFQVFLMLLPHFFNLFWKYRFFDCFFNFSNKTFIHLVCFFILWISWLQDFLIRTLFRSWRFSQTPSNPGTNDILWFYFNIFIQEILDHKLVQIFLKRYCKNHLAAKFV